MTLDEVLDQVYAGEMVILNNDWYWEEEEYWEGNRKYKKWIRRWTNENDHIFNEISLNYFRDIQMDDDGVLGAVVWIYLRKRK